METKIKIKINVVLKVIFIRPGTGHRKQREEVNFRTCIVLFLFFFLTQIDMEKQVERKKYISTLYQ